MANYSINQPSAHFQIDTYAGTGSGHSPTNDGPANLQPDFLWIKERDSNSYSNILTNTTRGLTKYIYTDSTQAEQTNSNRVTAANTDGFTLGTASDVNNNGNNYVAMCWKGNAGSSPSNTDGTRTALVQNNSTAGFSIIQFNAGSSTGGTVGHGLGEIPSFFMAKNMNATGGWYGMFPKIWGGNQSAGVNTTNAFGTVSGFSNFTSTLFTEGQSDSNDYMCYAWKPIRGYSAFGTYKSNNSSDGPKIFTGFRPAFIICKKTTGGAWRYYDHKRDGFNPENNYLRANVLNGENTAANSELEIHSNGFKLTNAEGDINYNAENVLYAAWAELPQVFTDGVPVQAR
tara:strand:- start:239 stop:1267 length:1029 start_codon:yes stop_codon:yes gene_type:complete